MSIFLAQSSRGESILARESKRQELEDGGHINHKSQEADSEECLHQTNYIFMQFEPSPHNVSTHISMCFLASTSSNLIS